MRAVGGRGVFRIVGATRFLLVCAEMGERNTRESPREHVRLDLGHPPPRAGFRGFPIDLRQVGRKKERGRKRKKDQLE